MLAAVSCAQPLGQMAVDLVVTFVGRQALKFDPSGLDSGSIDVRTLADSVWRTVIGIGVVPAVFAIVLRSRVPETPRYTMDVINDLRPMPFVETSFDDKKTKSASPGESTRIRSFSRWRSQTSDIHTRKDPWVKLKAFLREFWTYMWDKGNWRYLLGTSMCWFLFDCAFYGLGLNNSRAPLAIWASTRLEDISAAQWSQANSTELLAVINLAHQHSTLSLLMPTLGALIGCCAVHFSIDRLGRRRLQGLGFLGLSATLLALGSGIYGSMTPVLFFLCRLFFNFGQLNPLS
jgi:MFS transporter, PHS family, inorganic phosphate transporter